MPKKHLCFRRNLRHQPRPLSRAYRPFIGPTLKVALRVDLIRSARSQAMTAICAHRTAGVRRQPTVRDNRGARISPFFLIGSPHETVKSEMGSGGWLTAEV